MDNLIKARVQFNPALSLIGPFYATIYTTGASTPLWKELAKFSYKNIQGQEYSIIGNDVRNGGRVINYSEIFGKSFHLRAYGEWKNEIPVDDFITITEEKKKDSPYQSITSFFKRKSTIGKNSSSKRINSLLKCPVDYTVTVNKAEIVLLGQKVSIPISGTGALRVLYADEKLRIFVSPKDTTDSRWEKAGLKVIQVRIDLIDSNWKCLSSS